MWIRQKPTRWRTEAAQIAVIRVILHIYTDVTSSKVILKLPLYNNLYLMHFR